jgi:sugar-specific transcriptional regulator TrmB
LDEESKANAIFKFSKVARQDIYRILKELQQLGLVEKIIAQPTRYRAVSLSEAASILLKRKEQSLYDLKEEAEELVQHAAMESSGKAEFQKEGDRFALITDINAIECKARGVIEKAQERVLHITPYEELAPWLAHLSDVFFKAIERGVEVKWITEFPKNFTTLPEIVQRFIVNPRFRIRNVPSLPKVKFGICDGKEIVMALFFDHKRGEAPALWSDNPSLLSMAEEYFRKTWKAGSNVSQEGIQFEQFNKLNMPKVSRG